MLPFITKTIKHVIPTIALIALTILICFPSKINLLPEDCRVILADPAEIPYHVSIQFNGNHHCSGSLIDKKHVLTVAKCVDNPIAKNAPDSRMKVVVGTRKLPGGMICEVEKVAFDSSGYHALEGDAIAVIRLKDGIRESKYIKIIDLPKREQRVLAGQELIVSGFGPKRILKPTPWYLKKLTMKVVDDKRCHEHFPHQASVGNFCAVLDRGNAPCQTETGSPATVNQKYIIGIFSEVSRDGCVTGVPVLFTYVSYYLEFIQNETKTTG